MAKLSLTTLLACSGSDQEKSPRDLIMEMQSLSQLERGHPNACDKTLQEVKVVLKRWGYQEEDPSNYKAGNATIYLEARHHETKTWPAKTFNDIWLEARDQTNSVVGSTIIECL